MIVFSFLSCLLIFNLMILFNDGYKNRVPKMFQNITEKPIWNKLTLNDENVIQQL